MATATKSKRDVLAEEELSEFQMVDSVMEAGLPYLWIMSFGWAKVGFYVKHTAPNRILIAHCSHFRNAGRDYGALAMEGAGPECEWRYEGELVEINTAHVIETAPYNGKVHRVKK